ncbi:MAG TPA: hypothetical protein VF676_11555 [Flavobacterium sp.]|jgi:hypothetical protein
MNDDENRSEATFNDFKDNTDLEVPLPKKQVKHMLQEIEVMAMQRMNKNSFDMSSLETHQVDKVLETMHTNEQNAFEYHKAKLSTYKEIRLKEIGASVITEKNHRYFGLALIGLLSLITLLILFFKDSYFITWMTFIAGLLAGKGLSKLTEGKDSKLRDNAKLDDDLG